MSNANKIKATAEDLKTFEDFEINKIEVRMKDFPHYKSELIMGEIVN